MRRTGRDGRGRRTGGGEGPGRGHLSGGGVENPGIRTVLKGPEPRERLTCRGGEKTRFLRRLQGERGLQRVVTHGLDLQVTWTIREGCRLPCRPVQKGVEVTLLPGSIPRN